MFLRFLFSVYSAININNAFSNIPVSIYRVLFRISFKNDLVSGRPEVSGNTRHYVGSWFPAYLSYHIADCSINHMYKPGKESSMWWVAIM